MTNSAEIEKKPSNPGRITRWAGIAALLFALLVMLSFAFSSVDRAVPWFWILLGFALIVIGYLQKIAAK